MVLIFFRLCLGVLFLFSFQASVFAQDALEHSQWARQRAENQAINLLENLPRFPSPQQIAAVAQRLCPGDLAVMGNVFAYLDVRGGYASERVLGVVRSEGRIDLMVATERGPNGVFDRGRVIREYDLNSACVNFSQLIVDTARRRGVPVFEDANIPTLRRLENDFVNAELALSPWPQVSPTPRPVPPPVAPTGPFTASLACYAALNSLVPRNAEFRALLSLGERAPVLMISAVRGGVRGFYLYRGDMVWYVPWSQVQSRGTGGGSRPGFRHYSMDLRFPNRLGALSSRLYISIDRNEFDTAHDVVVSRSFVPRTEASHFTDDQQRLQEFTSTLMNSTISVTPHDALDRRSQEVLRNTLRDLLVRLPATPQGLSALSRCDALTDPQLQPFLEAARRRMPMPAARNPSHKRKRSRHSDDRGASAED